jgi:TolB-like protein/Tfp pilus assembly protein PilF
MKTCTKCHREYVDDSLNYCLEDGETLATSPANEAPTALNIPEIPSELPSWRRINTTDATAMFPTVSVSPAVSRKYKFLIVAAIAAVLATAGAFIYRTYFVTSNSLISSIAVMPFTNASGDPAIEYLSDGMTESLIGTLSRLPNLSVKARSSVYRYKGKETSPQIIGKELGVQAILNGRVVQRADQLTLSLELIDAQTENVIWSDRYVRNSSDLVLLQNEIARDVSTKLKTKLSGADEQNLAKNYTANPKAYQLYLLGRFYWNKQTVSDFRKSIEFLQQAIATDPNYALAYAGLADAYVGLSSYNGAPPREVFPKAREATLKSLSLDDQLAEAHTTLGHILCNDYDFAGAEREYKRALELNPNDASTHLGYGYLHIYFGRHEEGLAEARRASEIEPLSLIVNRAYGDQLLYARRYDESIAQLKKTLELDANFESAHNSLAYAYWVKGNYSASVEEFAKRRDVGGDQQLGALYRESFAKGGWEGFLRMRKDEFRISNATSYGVAIYAAALGEKTVAFAELNKAYENREFGVLLLKVDPRLDPLRSDPRFQELVKRIGFPE